MSKSQEPKNRRTELLAAFILILWFFGSLVLWHSAAAAGEVPPLTDEELATPQQQALLMALGGDPYSHRAADHCRAGHAFFIRPGAIPSNTPHYGGYWVGGGKAIRGDHPALDDGTFGWDYFGVLFTKRVALHWSHGRLHQGGTGAYKTDSPKVRHE
jgi:hypothetical protein